MMVMSVVIFVFIRIGHGIVRPIPHGIDGSIPHGMVRPIPIHFLRSAGLGSLIRTFTHIIYGTYCAL